MLAPIPPAKLAELATHHKAMVMLVCYSAIVDLRVPVLRQDSLAVGPSSQKL